MAHRGIIIIVASSMTLAFASAATAVAPAKDAQVKAQKQVQEPTYCIATEPFTGSRVAKTECKTKEEWARDGVDVDKLNKQ